MTAGRPLLESISELCKRPGLYFADPARHYEPTLNAFLLFVLGADFARSEIIGQSEWMQFTTWVFRRHPEHVQGEPAWFGVNVLKAKNGNDLLALEEIGRMATEYVAEMKH